MSKFIFILLVLTACASTRMNIIHDYVFYNAEKLCADHEGVHYIFAETKILGKGTKLSNDYPCKEKILIRCQDQTLKKFDTGVGYCFISEAQIKETLESQYE